MLHICKKLLAHSTLYIRRNNSSKTIFALSSGQGKCGVAVIRVSGKHAGNALKSLTNLQELPEPRKAILKSIENPNTHETLDKGLILWFPSPKSFTGEDSCELHVHGGTAVINAVLTALSSIENLAIAEPGEFTRRAFFNGKLDLTEVEGLADLLQAETEFQRKQAFLQSHGALSKLYTKWKERLIKCVAYLEAYIDFDETETLDESLLETVREKVQDLSREIAEHLSDGRRGEILRSGVKTCIIGEPNVGKSSLLNILCKRPAAIVTPIAGTTRDILEVTLNFGGYPLVLMDTAGLRNKTDDVIESEGISKALQTYQGADLIILMINAVNFVKWTKETKDKAFSKYLKQYTESMNINLSNKKHIIVLNKIDILQGSLQGFPEDSVEISCITEIGITNLVNNIISQLKNICGNPTKDHPSLNQLRHRQHLSDCLKNLNKFLDKSSGNHPADDLVLLVEYLRKAIRHQEKLLGKITTEHILDVIFKDFCIGK